ncbi:MAG TPA: very short patch repair endonuclease [Phycisphaerae bacterium]|nr:very short patch repair endonuclease [Phycisphaerae bacterium]
MADHLTRAQRSRHMAKIRGDDLKPEATLRAALRRAGFRYWRNVRWLWGTPDVVLRRAPLAVLVHGCYWHGCARHYRAPKTNRAFWRAKVAGNRRRDARTRGQLNRNGWSVMVVWEHELRDVDRVVARIRRRAAALRPIEWAA